ncbi:MAG: malto-oligosyltrehalose synthase [Nitrospirae bacterium]|nr:malto-oligosyltrehalose synthase [Nitrospirota bacterium]
MKDSPSCRIPVSTYRLQFNASFRFSDAKKLVPYLHELGITDIYASPYFKAKKNSTHGYDIADQNQLNPEIGTEQDFSAFSAQLSSYDMGHILDVVPNHMCITSPENRWWMDILENGPSSLYADFFDISWVPVKKELKDKVLLPILGDQYGRVLENQELLLTLGDTGFFISYNEHCFPIRPETYQTVLGHRIETLGESTGADDQDFVELRSILTALSHLPHYTDRDKEQVDERYREKEISKKRLANLKKKSGLISRFIDENISLFNGVKGQPESFDLLDGLLSEQVYRLSHWRVAMDEINYRRFFDINELAALRVERPEVFEEVHRFIFELVRDRKITGLRVDHADGLYNPTEYLRKLQLGCLLESRPEAGDASVVAPQHPEGAGAGNPDTAAGGTVPASVAAPFYLVVEKILMKGEKLPGDWPVHGTTGYSFLNTLNSIFIDMDNAKQFDAVYKKFTGITTDFQELIYEKKKLIMNVAMAGEINTLGHILNSISETNRLTRDFTLNSLIKAVTDTIALFPVYRAYSSTAGVDDRDRRYVELAVSKAKKRNPAISPSIFDFLMDVLLLNYPQWLGEKEKEAWLDFTMRFQQLTGPVMAKGVEDTAFYSFNRFVSLNEVGGSPERFGASLNAFHGQNIERLKQWPHSLITSSTHDTKRGEDVRARMNVISEIPDQWRQSLRVWARANRKKRPLIEGQPVPDRNEEYLLYQTLAGTWPLKEMGGSELAQYNARIGAYMLKSLREAKTNSSWTSPNAAYEEAAAEFIRRITAPRAENSFLRDFLQLQKKISHCGLFNSLSQTLLKITSPGVPDFFQGTEIWEFSLVDPDNRRPVDYTLRTKMLHDLKALELRFDPPYLLTELLRSKEDGRIKLYVTYKALTFRRQKCGLFSEGEYVPLEVSGLKAKNIICFGRQLGEAMAIVIVPRFLTEICGEHAFPLGAEVWGDSFLTLPETEKGARYRNIFTDEQLTVGGQGAAGLYLDEVFSISPVALLERL